MQELMEPIVLQKPLHPYNHKTIMIQIKQKKQMRHLLGIYQIFENISYVIYLPPKYINRIELKKLIIKFF